MNLLLSKVKVIDPLSKHNMRLVDIDIRNGKIVQIAKKIKNSKSKNVTLDGACISPGWVDIGTQIGEPGYEHREDMESVSNAALAGGFTAIAPFPNTNPVVDSKSGIAFIINKSSNLPIYFYPIGSVSKGSKGGDLAELIDMYREGAVAFSDGNHSIQSSGLLIRALDYVKAFDGLIIDHAVDESLQPGADINEGVISTQLGMKGQPGLAEKIQITKNLDLLKYSNSKLLCHLISSKEGVDTIKEGKKEGLRIGASTSVFHLCRNEENIIDFDSNYKILPPLRTLADQKSLIKGIERGTIDIICSNHVPLDPESKVMAFADATPGSISLQTVFPLLSTHLGDQVSIETIVQCLSHNPRRWLGLPDIIIEKDNDANLTIFNPDENWTFSKEENRSKSSNSALIGESFTGKVIGTIVKGKSHWNS